MKLVFSSGNRNFLDLFEPEITLLEDLVIAEDAKTVSYFLEEEGLDLQDLVDVGLKLVSHRVNDESVSYHLREKEVTKIIVPKGTTLKVVSMDDVETTFEIAKNGVSVMFDYIMTFPGDGAVVEATAIDNERENAFAKFNGKNIVKENDDTILFNYYLRDILTAVYVRLFNEENKSEAFESIKVMTREEIERVIKNYNAYIEAGADKDAPEYKLSLDSKLIKNILGKR